MDGVFMKKIIKILVSACLLLVAIGTMDIYRDKKALQENVIRLHVVANSDSQEDQEFKLQIKDYIVAYLQPKLKNMADKEQTMILLTDEIDTIQQLVNTKLKDLGASERAVVCLGSESFGTRKYETFSLPAGVYDSLRIQIGEGKGKNWWCVVFPSLCVPATADEFQDAAVSSGFSEDLGSTLAGGRNFRFFILDCLGRIEKFFY